MYFDNLLCVILFVVNCTFAAMPRIAIIGGGIGGSSCAYFLRTLFKENVQIDVYEAEEVGGRLSIVNFGKKEYEVGGSIIHSRNKYMSDFLSLLKLKKREQSSNSYFGLYNGSTFVFEESTWKILTLFKLIKRYGLGFWRLKNQIDGMLDDFEKIYNYQEDGCTYNNITSLLSAMDSKFIDYLRTSSKTGFQEEGFSELVINELIMATLRTNYGQGLNVHKFVGSVSVAGAGGGLWAVDGGNAQVPEKLLNISRARLISSAVVGVRRLSSNEMKLFLETETDSSDADQTYNIVIVAAPQTSDAKHQIQFENFSKQFSFPGRYHQTVCTLVKGALRDEYFRDKKSYIDGILSIKDSTLFNSVGRINPVDYREKNSNKSDVWKVFSQRPLTEGELSLLFSDIGEKYVKVWLAYPEYDANGRDDTFVLDENLYHISAIDWAASSMEMSVIGAKNVALLAFQSWSSTDDNSLEENEVNERDEL